MFFALLPLGLTVVCLGMSSQTPSQTSRLEAALVARLRQEILWQDAEVDRESTNPNQTTAAIWTNSKVLAYCSLELRRCAEYELLGFRLGQRIRVNSQLGKDNLVSLRSFVPLRSKQTKPEDPGPVFGGGRRGEFDPDSGITWFASRSLGTRSEIIAYYAKLKPSRLQEVLTHLREESDHSAYTSMTVACFAAEDELVYVHGVRPKLGEIVFSLIWDEEAGWRTAGMVEMLSDPETTTSLRDIINKMPCGVIQF